MPAPPVDAISTAILSAPGWARVGITVPDGRLREQAADALARAIVDDLWHIPDTASEDQLALPM